MSAAEEAEGHARATAHTRAHTVCSASVGESRAARRVGTRLATAPIRTAAASPPTQALVGTTTSQPLAEEYDGGEDPGRDPDRADQERHRTEPEEEAVEGALRLGAGGEGAGGPADLDLVADAALLGGIGFDPSPGALVEVARRRSRPPPRSSPPSPSLCDP